MKKMIGFPSIEQFRNVISNINRISNFIGLDAQGEPIYNESRAKPILTFTGTVKLHGTNAGVCYNSESGLWAQSRENIITREKDNAGFAAFVEAREDAFKALIIKVAEKENINLSENTIAIYGEWAGSGIQKGIGISNLEKSFFIFGVKISPFSEDLKSYWVDYTGIKNNEERIFNILDFQTYQIEIDFNMPQLVQNKLADYTIDVENQCPVAKSFGFEGIGEGIVWTCDYRNERYAFKVKGEKHSSSKVKTLASVDVDKLHSIKDFVEYAVSENRFNQALEKVFLNNEPIDTKKLGDVIRWVVGDVMKEEADTLAQNNIEPKEVNKYISAKVREMFFALC